MSEKRLIDANALEKHSFLAHLGDHRVYIVPLRAIKSAPAIDAVEVSVIEAQIDEAHQLLDELNGEGRVEYDAYRRLHDAIGIIGMRKEPADEN